MHWFRAKRYYEVTHGRAFETLKTEEKVVPFHLTSGTL